LLQDAGGAAVPHDDGLFGQLVSQPLQHGWPLFDDLYLVAFIEQLQSQLRTGVSAAHDNH
jgi:hypothetical protein